MKSANETISEMLSDSDLVGKPNVRTNARLAKPKGKLRSFIKILSEMFGG